MCFSATASFVTAGVTGLVGAVAAGRVRERRELPFAATPLFFALQQALEGLLWLTLPVAPGGSGATGLALAFLFFAEVFWPVYLPAAVLLIEPDRARRRLMLACLVAGATVAAYLLWRMLAQPPSTAIVNDHIVYATEPRYSYLVGITYLVAIGLPLLLSSQRTVAAVGAIVLVGSATAYVFYWEAFVSVWCFFAAAASVAILGHFEWSRRRRRAAGAPQRA
jgi:hypothetical protein